MFLISCSTDNDLSVEQKFYLVNVSGGFAGVNENFDKGQIIWTFNEQNSTLNIEKTTNESFSGLNEGVYSFDITLSALYALKGRACGEWLGWPPGSTDPHGLQLSVTARFCLFSRTF